MVGPGQSPKKPTLPPGNFQITGTCPPRGPSGQTAKPGLPDGGCQPSQGAGLMPLHVLFPDLPVSLLFGRPVSHPWNPSQSSVGVQRHGLAPTNVPAPGATVRLTALSSTLPTTCFLQPHPRVCWLPAPSHPPPSPRPQRLS